MSRISNRSVRRPVCVAVALVLSLGRYALAQGGGSVDTDGHDMFDATRHAVVDGTVRDTNGSFVPGARLRLRVADIGGIHEATTGPDGAFALRRLPPGRYALSVDCEGYRSREIEGLMVAAGEEASLRIELEPAGDRGASFGESERGTGPSAPESTVVWRRDAAEAVPLSGRSIQPLVTLAPGVSLTRATLTDMGQFSANGQRANSNYFVIDGVSANIGVAAGATGLGQSGSGSLPSLSALGTTHALATPDTVALVSVMTSAIAPEFGRTAGAQIALTTRSGSNAFHGSLFAKGRIPAFGARAWFDDANASRSDAPSHVDASAAVGGPVARDRTFFFASVDALRLDATRFATRSVPALAARASAPDDVRRYLNAFPLPTGAESQQKPASHAASFTDRARASGVNIRIDHDAGPRASLFARYSRTPSRTHQRGLGSASLNTIQTLDFLTETITGGMRLELAHGFTNDLRVSLGRAHAAKSFDLDEFGGAHVLTSEFLYPRGFDANDALLSLDVGGTTIVAGKDATNRQGQLNLVDTLEVVAGSHRLKFGVDFRRLTPTYGGWRYHQVVTLDATTGTSTGHATSAVVQSQTDVALSFLNLSAFAQDEWRASPDLSVTYGLRWEINPPPSGRGDRPLYTVRGALDPGALRLAEPGTPLFETRLGNLAPRLGLAYSLARRAEWDTVVRAGIGLFYDLGTGPVANAANSFPYQRRRYVEGIRFPLDSVVASPLPLSYEPPVAAIRAADPRLRLPRTLQWNVGIEQSLGARSALSAAWVGAAGRDLLRTRVLVDPSPEFSRVYLLTNEAASRYDALKVLLRTHAVRGAHAFVSYTLARSVDDVSSDAQLGDFPSAAYRHADRGPSDFDARHALTGGLTVDVSQNFDGALSRALLSDWSFDAIVSARSALPVDVVFFREPFAFRPDRILGIPLYVTDVAVPGGRRINQAAFSIPSHSGNGSFGRNVLRGFRFVQVDLALRRRLALTEGLAVTIGAELFNAFNTINYADPVSFLGDPRFGRPVAMLAWGISGTSGLEPTYQAGGPRSLQLAIRLQF
jgi:hypothetical protein